MKTPMQELLEWVRATLPMDLDTPRLIEEKIESMLEKEKQELKDAFEMGVSAWASGCTFEYYYNETYKDTE